MKKALTITLAGTLFTIEEDAYEKLKTYLDSVKAYFDSYHDAEIIQDIEARMAERLMGKKDAVLTLYDVDTLITAMGRVEDFKEAESGTTHTESHSDAHTSRKLYRDPENAVIFGVCSGLAHYFNIDPLIVRIVFIVLALIQGGGILLYIILALLLPKAESPAEKIQMRGGPTNLHSFRETLNNQVHTIKKNGTDLLKESKFKSFLEWLVLVIGKIFKGILYIIMIVIGAGVTLAAFATLAMATFVLVNLIFNSNSPYIEFPIAEVVSGPVYFFLVTLGYLCIAIPVIALLVFSSYLIRRKKVASYKTLLVLGSIWIVAAMALGTLSIRYVPEIRSRIHALPQYQVTEHTEILPEFNKLDMHGINSVTLIQGTTSSITVQGRSVDLERTAFEVENNTLVTTERNQSKMCFLCLGRDRLDVVIITPTINDIILSGATSLAADTIISDEFSISLDGVSSIEIGTLTSKKVIVAQSGGTRAKISGTADTLDINLSGVALFNGSNLIVSTSTIEASGNSRAQVNVTKDLTASVSGVSRVIYTGTPKVMKDESGNAEVRSQGEKQRQDEEDMNDF